MKQMFHTVMYPLLKLYSNNIKFMFWVKFTLWLDIQNFTKFVLEPFNEKKTHILILCKKEKKRKSSRQISPSEAL